MKSLPEYPTELDLYINSLLDLLRTRYYNVSVNRGSVKVTFFYDFAEISTTIPSHLYVMPNRISIPNTELLNYFETKQTPPQILNLIK